MYQIIRYLSFGHWLNGVLLVQFEMNQCSDAAVIRRGCTLSSAILCSSDAMVDIAVLETVDVSLVGSSPTCCTKLAARLAQSRLPASLYGPMDKVVKLSAFRQIISSRKILVIKGQCIEFNFHIIVKGCGFNECINGYVFR